MCCLPERKLKTESTQTNQKPNWQKAKFKKLFLVCIFVACANKRKFLTRNSLLILHSTFDACFPIQQHIYIQTYIKTKFSKHERGEFGKLSSKSVHASSNLFHRGKCQHLPPSAPFQSPRWLLTCSQSMLVSVAPSERTSSLQRRLGESAGLL